MFQIRCKRSRERSEQEKIYLLVFLFLAFSFTGFGQESKSVNVYVNYSAAFRAEKAGNCFTGNDGATFSTGFYNKNLRIDVRGKATDKFYYRFRHRFNKENKACNDNFAKATDIAMVGYHATDELTFKLGKQTLIWGGYEYDEHPYEVYQFSDMNEIIENYTPGIIVDWKPNDQQEFVAEVANSSCYTFEESYPYAVKTNDNENNNDNCISASRHPLTYIAGWYGSLWGGIVTTRWAVGYVTTARGKGSKAITLGQRLRKGNFRVWLDYMSSFDDIDRLGIVAEETDNKIYKNTRYNSFIAKADYHFAPRWNAFVKGFYETASAPDYEALKNYRKGIGFYVGLEYYPVKSQDLRFSLSYQGRHFSYTDASQSIYGLRPYSTTRIELGMMYFMKCL